MAKSLIPEIAKMLGVTIGEEFEIKGYSGKFKFSEYEFLAQVESKEHKYIRANSVTFVSLVNGGVEIIRLPYKPKFGGKYWTYEDDTCEVVEKEWLEDFGDYKNKKLGLVFRTKNEALMERPDCYEAVTGHTWMVEG